jgi:uncharacterized LabA/DUF88 family protein
MLIYTYVDNSNVFIEGQRVSAVRKGLARNIIEAMNNKIVDYSWNIDYGKLHEFLCGENKSEIGCAKLWGSPPPKDSFWKLVERKGFEVKTYERNYSGKEKRVDVAIAHQITKDAYTLIDKHDSEISLVAGDQDYVPLVEDLVNSGFLVMVVFWEHASKDLKEAASKFISLDPFLGHLAY